MRAKTKGYATGNKALNQSLDLMAQHLTECYEQHRAAGTVPTKDQLQDAIKPDSTEPAAAATDVLSAYEAWMTQDSTLTENTRRTQVTSLRHLQAWAATTPGRKLTWAAFDGHFVNRFADYLIRERDLNDHSLWKNVMRVKAFLSWASKQREGGRATGKLLYPTGTEWQQFKWKKSEPVVIALSREELTKLQALDLSASPAMDNARALFLIGCYSGLRFSDVWALRPEHVQADRIVITTQKTRDPLTIPLRPELVPLMQRVTDRTLRPLTNQYLNRYLKIIGQKAGLDNPVQTVTYQRGKRKEQTLPKWALLSTHTARRSYVTLSLEAGMRPDVVMAISGHRDYKTFRRYISVTADDVLRESKAKFGGG